MTRDPVALVGVAEDEFVRLRNEAEAALNALARFWTRLYGPNEACTAGLEELREMDREFFGAEGEG